MLYYLEVLAIIFVGTGWWVWLLMAAAITIGSLLAIGIVLEARAAVGEAKLRRLGDYTAAYQRYNRP